MRKEEPQAVLTAIMICVAALGCLGFVALVRSASIESAPTQSVMYVDTSDWLPYRDAAHGFTLLYPPDWTIDTEWLASDPSYIALGNPLSGTSTYTMRVYVENNTSSLSSSEYAHALLAAAQAEDAANAAAGPAPRVAPAFQSVKTLTVNGYPAYDLYGVFEFDHNAERVYVAHGDIALRFDFPVAEENPNLSLPVANNAVAHEIMNTLTFTK